MSAVACTVQALLANAGVTALVSRRVYPGIAPQSSQPPDMVVTRISGGPLYALRQSTSTTSSRVSIECRGRTFTDVDKAGEAVIKALQNLRGTFAGRRAEFQAAGSDTEDHADDASIFRRIVDFYVWTHEPA